MPATVDVDHEFCVFEGFEAIEDIEVDQPCLTVGDGNPIRVGARLAVWNEIGDSIVATGQLTPGTIQYDDTGPAIGDDGQEFFYFYFCSCSCWISFEDLPVAETFRFEYPGEEDLSGITTTADLLGGAFTDRTSSDNETERQRIRA